MTFAASTNTCTASPPTCNNSPWSPTERLSPDPATT
jgi:hypothetical protein